MRLLRSLMRRLESMTAKETFNAELSEELQFHLAHAVEENMSRGMTKDEALRVAGHSFGSVAVITEDSYRARRTARFDDLKQDVRYGLRTISPPTSLAPIRKRSAGCSGKASFQTPQSIAPRNT